MENHNVRFTTEPFDYRSDLPEHYTAGKRFHGRDLAEFLATGLAAHQPPGRFFDDDWGWVVECQAARGRGDAPSAGGPRQGASPPTSGNPPSAVR